MLKFVIIFLIILIIFIRLKYNYEYYDNQKIIYYNGRPEGLGNRLEELINLEVYCEKNNCKCNYYWNNIHKHRTYEILIKCKNINIQSNKKYNNPNLDIDKLFYISNNQYTNNDMINYSKNIQPLFSYPKLDYNYDAVHIRSTDRIKNKKYKNKSEEDNDHSFTYDTFIKNLDKTIKIINKKKKKYIAICSDNEKYKKYFINKLNKDIRVVEPLKDANINNSYKDFYTLVYAKSIYMVPKGSSFALTASLLGNNLVYSYFKNHKFIDRYKANVQYL
jgi:hypothetical protein